MEEQFELDFGPKPEKQGQSNVPDPQTLSDDDLAALYKATIGIDPVLRVFDRQTMLAGIAAGRDAERARIKLMEDEENRDSIATSRIS